MNTVVQAAAVQVCNDAAWYSGYQNLNIDYTVADTAALVSGGMVVGGGMASGC